MKSTEDVAHAELVGGGETAKHSHSGGSSPRIFYAVNTDTGNLGTSLGTIPYTDAVKKDSDYVHSGGSGEVTIIQAGWYEFHWMVQCTGASSRVELRAELQINGTKVKGTACYTARNSSQNTGGIVGHHIAYINANDVARIQALRDGSTANKIAGDCSLLIRSL